MRILSLFYKLALALLVVIIAVNVSASQVCLDEIKKSERSLKMQSVCDALCRSETQVKSDKFYSVQKTSLVPDEYLDSEVSKPIYNLILQAIKRSGSTLLAEKDLRAISVNFNSSQDKKYRELFFARKAHKERLEIVKTSLSRLSKNAKNESSNLAKDKNSSWGFIVDKESESRLKGLSDLVPEVNKLKNEKDDLVNLIFQIDRQFNAYNALISRLYMTTSAFTDLSELSLNIQITGLQHWVHQNQNQMTVYIRSGLFYFSVSTSDYGQSTNRIDLAMSPAGKTFDLACDQSSVFHINTVTKKKSISEMLLPTPKDESGESYDMYSSWLVTAKESIQELVKEHDPRTIEETLELVKKVNAAQKIANAKDPRLTQALDAVERDDEAPFIYQSYLLREAFKGLYRAQTGGDLFADRVATSVFLDQFEIQISETIDDLIGIDSGGRESSESQLKQVIIDYMDEK